MHSGSFKRRFNLSPLNVKLSFVYLFKLSSFFVTICLNNRYIDILLPCFDVITGNSPHFTRPGYTVLDFLPAKANGHFLSLSYCTWSLFLFLCVTITTLSFFLDNVKMFYLSRDSYLVL